MDIEKIERETRTYIGFRFPTTKGMEAKESRVKLIRYNKMFIPVEYFYGNHASRKINNQNTN